MDSIDDVKNMSDVDSCMHHLREASLYKMMNDPNHRAMLFLLEVLMNSERSMTIEELAIKFFSDIVSTGMQGVCGTSAAGLRSFLEKYPSLFRIEHGMVTSMDVADINNEDDIINGNEFDLKHDYPRLRRPVDLSTETEAVKYFQSQLTKKDERWVPIKSLAGHLSQAPENIRQTVGSQSYFRTFLQRHPHVFEIQGDLVGLQDQFSSLCLSRPIKPRPKSTIITRKTPSKNARPTSMIINSSPVHSDNILPSSQSNNSLAIDSREFQAAMFLRGIIRKSPRARMSLSHLFLYLAKAPQSIRDCIGWTKVEMQEFLHKQPSLFEITESGFVRSLDTEEISVFVNDSSSTNDGMRTIINQKGSVYHVSKLWGIIDLGQHEHVFFDKSIFRHLDDLQRHFKIGEFLYFNAILAPKQSRAKWRATQVWKECDKDMVQKFCGDIIAAPYMCINDISMHDNDSGSCGRSVMSEQRHIIDNYHEVDEELAEILQLSKIDSDGESSHWDNQLNYKGVEIDDSSVMSVASRSSTTSSPTEGVSGYSNQAPSNNGRSHQSSSSREITNNRWQRSSVTTCSVATQTISTGEIMAVHMYHEPDITGHR